MSQIDTEKKTKTQNFPFFKVLCNFIRFLIDFVDSNVAKRQQGKHISPVGLCEEFIAVF